MTAELSLEPSRLGLHLGPHAVRVSRLGRYRRVAPGEPLCVRDRVERELHVILDLRVDHRAGWLGPGAHVGELGFLLGVPRTSDVRAAEGGWVWTCHADALAGDPFAGTLLVAALVHELPSRIQKFEPPSAPAQRFCDHDHPAIVSLAAVLRGADAADTAARIWAYVRAMPYRFGPWWMRASETLEMGWGMCTTKSNLQVALLRAAGLEAGFVELEGAPDLLAPLIPERWRPRISPRIRHYMAAVRLSGAWHVMEGSFTDETLALLEASRPDLPPLRPCRFAEGRPFFPLAPVCGLDPWSVSVLPDLDAAMARRSTFDLDQLELLNLVNDRVQGPVHRELPQIRRARALLDADPPGALLAALGAASTLASTLHLHLRSLA
jgi:hypothetical protein